MNEALCPSVASVSDDKGATSRWKPYPNYKDSGIEWLGEIPEHWDIYRLKYCVDLINEKVDGRESTLPYIGLEHIEPWTGKLVSVVGEISTDSQANHFKPGDVLFGKLRPYLAKVLCAKEEGICTGELLVLRPTRILQCYLFNYMLTREWILIVDSSTYGAKMPRASWEFIGKLPVLVPPVEEQRAIAAFLDRETARIDAIIEKKQRQIELLQEKRTALISHAVTKGLNPDVKMKDSGIEWLGEVPEHWEVKPIKRVASYNDEVLPETTDPDFEIEYVDISGVDEIDGIRTTQIFRFENAPSRARRRVQDGDIIVSTVRTYLKAIAGVHNPPENMIVSTGFCVIRPCVNLETGFARYLFKANYLINDIVARSVGVSYPAINASDLVAIKVALPSLEEQRAIAAFLDRETARIDTLIEKIRASIDLLREYRTALISAAVTGKIDVRKEVS